ncbi:MAG TPA: hypothetical protein VFQ00_05205 [Terriglobales bacterium]|nr:hypothetical protein [Terriglobales bacterium]
MPLFILAPVWMLCVVLGFASLFFTKARYLSAYLLLGSTFGMAGAFALFLIETSYVDRHITNSAVSLFGYLASPFIGAALCTPIGLLAASKLNGTIGRLIHSKRPI